MFRKKISNYLFGLCQLTTAHCLLEVVVDFTMTLCFDPIPNTKYFKQISKALSVFVFYDDDEEIIVKGLKAYCQLINDIVRFDGEEIEGHRHHGRDRYSIKKEIDAVFHMQSMMSIKNEYKQKIKNDDKIFKKSLKEWSHNFPMDIIDECHSFYKNDVSDIKFDLIHRFISLLEHKDDQVKYLVLINLQIITQYQIIGTTHYLPLVASLKPYIMHSGDYDSNDEFILEVYPIAHNIAILSSEDHSFDVETREFIKPLMQSITNDRHLKLNEPAFLTVAYYLDRGTDNVKKYIIDNQFIDLLFKFILNMITAKTMSHDLIEDVNIAIAILLDLSVVIDDNSISDQLETGIQWIRSNEMIKEENQDWVDHLTHLIENHPH